MLLRRLDTRGTLSGLPRPRGDAPLTLHTGLPSYEFAPPTRGCSRRARQRLRPVCVCPAHAGMLRTRRSQTSARRSLPRPRGDAPLAAEGIETLEEFAPPTRGCSRLPVRSVRGGDVCPAHAGMLLGLSWGKLLEDRLPRPRGDAPIPKCGAGPDRTFAPPTRGCSRSDFGEGDDSRVCPAHAGMLPAQTNGREPPPSLPRPRGDAPRAVHFRAMRYPFAPPTRGCSPLPSTRRGDRQVCPALAGMLPSAR